MQFNLARDKIFKKLLLCFLTGVAMLLDSGNEFRDV